MNPARRYRAIASARVLPDAAFERVADRRPGVSRGPRRMRGGRRHRQSPRMRSTVRRCELPDGALLQRYSVKGGYADCYGVEVAGTISHAEYVEAFYTTSLFKLERSILQLLVSRPSTDTEAKHLAQGSRDSFAAWSVEGRARDQLLMSDFTGRTKSWLMVVPMADSATSNTRLLFGSAVLPRGEPGEGRSLGFLFTALLGFHKLYSRALLTAARSRLAR